MRKIIAKCNCKKASKSIIRYGKTILNDDNETCKHCGNFAFWEKEAFYNSFTDEQKKEMLNMSNNGLSQRKIAKEFDVSQFTIGKILKELRTTLVAS